MIQKMPMSSGGVSVAQTDLWTNESPTTAINNATDITLSDSISNYDYLKFDFATYTNSSAKESSLIISVDDFKKGTISAYNPLITLVSVVSAGNGSINRAILYKNDTTITIDKGYYSGATGNEGAYSIPLKIIGLKGLTL